MKTLHIEWQHIEKNGKTCNRCAETGRTLAQLMNELTEELRPHGIDVNVQETKLSPDEVSESNRLFFNGTAFEDLLPDVTVSESPCSSCGDVCGCGDLCGTTVQCRTVIHEGTVHEDIPAILIRKAALTAVGLQDTTWK